MPDGLLTLTAVPAANTTPPFSIAALGAELSRLHAAQDALERLDENAGNPTLRGNSAYETIDRSIDALEQAVLMSRAQTLPDVLTQLCVANGEIDTLTGDNLEGNAYGEMLVRGYKNVLQGAVRLLAQHIGVTVQEAAGACYVPARLDYWLDPDTSPVSPRDGFAIDGSGAAA